MLKQHSEMYGSDDWLAEEIKRENRISAWDIDGGRLLREEHAANCDARRLAAEHALGCEAEVNAEAHRREHSGSALDAEFRKAMRKAEDRIGSETPEARKNMQRALFGGFVLMVLFPPLLLLIAPAAVGYVLYLANRNKQ